MRFFATAAKGTEPALRDELRELGFAQVRADRGGVHFEGSERDAYRACLATRIALRVLTPVVAFPCPDEGALYGGVHQHDFADVLSPRHTLAVTAVCRASYLTHTQYVAQRTKDAVVDRQRARYGSRSSVNAQDPDVHLFVHLSKNVASVFLDFAGESLHRRGYRLDAGEAPMKENLAAAVLRYSGWDRQTPFCDPMCGAGTLAIEAAAWAMGRAPGSSRRFGFERWANFGKAQQRELASLREALRASEKGEIPTILARDAAPRALELVRENARRAGVRLTLERGQLSELRLVEPGTVATNPPYGRRLSATAELGRELARMVDRHPDHSLALLMAAEQPMGRTRRRPEVPRQVFNGDIECLVRLYAPLPRH